MKRALTAIWRFVLRLARGLLVLLIVLLVVWGIIYLGFDRLLHAAH